MSLADSIKGLFLKRHPTAHESNTITQRKNDGDNPYLTARRTWNEHVGSVVSSRQTWQVVGILSLLIALASVGGMIHIGSQSKFVPYVIEVDKLGHVLAAGPAAATSQADPRVLSATVATFIENARTVTPDGALQRKAVFGVYAHLASNDPATAKMNEWLNSHADATPFARAAKEMVSIETTSVLAQSPDTWQVDWIETTRDRQGVVQGKPANMRALVTIYTTDTTSQTSEEQIRNNPLGIYVRDFSWSHLL